MEILMDQGPDSWIAAEVIKEEFKRTWYDVEHHAQKPNNKYACDFCLTNKNALLEAQRTIY